MLRWLMALLIAFPLAAAAQGTLARRLLTGVVVARVDQQPLGHSNWSRSSRRRVRRSTDGDAGRFAFQGVAPGVYRLRVTHLGFAPSRNLGDYSHVTPPQRACASSWTKFRFASRDRTDQGRRAMRRARRAGSSERPRILHHLSAARTERPAVSAARRFVPVCVPAATHDLFGARRQRAGIAPRPDTIMLRSDKPGWTYHPGRVVSTDFISRQRSMHLPTLSDFASDDFVKNHCFRYAGEVAHLRRRRRANRFSVFRADLITRCERNDPARFEIVSRSDVPN